MGQSAPFLGRLLVNIFSKIAADFCHDFELTLYIEGIFFLSRGGGGVSFPFFNGCKYDAFCVLSYAIGFFLKFK